MRTYARLARLILTAITALVLVCPALADDIPATVAKDARMSMLVKLLQAADLIDTLKQKGPFTLLAPSNSAFAKLASSSVENLLKPENKAYLRKMLLYHVISGKMTAAELTGTSIGTKGPTLSGDELMLTSINPIRVNDATVVGEDIRAENGVVHLIDTVLMPISYETTTITAFNLSKKADTSAKAANPQGSRTILETLEGDPQFSTLVTLMKVAGFADTLAKRDSLTVFAPTNEAFYTLPAGILEMLQKPENLSRLQEFLKFHIVPGRYDAAGLSALNGQSLSTALSGAALTVSLTGGLHINNATVVKTDAVAKNGVVHIINAVLLPPSIR